MARRPKATHQKDRPTKSALDKNGHEMPDPRPLVPAVDLRREPTLAERIRDSVRSERLAQEARSAGAETFEESEDFNVGDDYDPSSPYEEDFDPPLHPRPQAAQKPPQDPSGTSGATPPQGDGGGPGGPLVDPPTTPTKP